MNFLKNRWKEILIYAMLIMLGVVFASVFRCKHSPINPEKVKIDSLVKENQQTNVNYFLVFDSLKKVIRAKDTLNILANRKIESITAKYRTLMNREPSHDTVVKTHEVFIGNECLEKMPVMEAQLSVCRSEIDDLKALVKVKTDHAMALQGQFDRSICLNQEQQKEMKKLQRQKRANKAWAVVATGGAAAAIIGMLVVK